MVLVLFVSRRTMEGRTDMPCDKEKAKWRGMEKAKRRKSKRKRGKR